MGGIQLRRIITVKMPRKQTNTYCDSIIIYILLLYYNTKQHKYNLYSTTVEHEIFTLT